MLRRTRPTKVLCFTCGMGQHAAQHTGAWQALTWAASDQHHKRQVRPVPPLRRLHSAADARHQQRGQHNRRRVVPRKQLNRHVVPRLAGGRLLHQGTQARDGAVSGRRRGAHAQRDRAAVDRTREHRVPRRLGDWLALSCDHGLVQHTAAMLDAAVDRDLVPRAHQHQHAHGQLGDRHRLEGQAVAVAVAVLVVVVCAAACVLALVLVAMSMLMLVALAAAAVAVLVAAAADCVAVIAVFQLQLPLLLLRGMSLLATAGLPMLVHLRVQVVVMLVRATTFAVCMRATCAVMGIAAVLVTACLAVISRDSCWCQLAVTVAALLAVTVLVRMGAVGAAASSSCRRLHAAAAAAGCTTTRRLGGWLRLMCCMAISVIMAAAVLVRAVTSTTPGSWSGGLTACSLLLAASLLARLLAHVLMRVSMLTAGADLLRRLTGAVLQHHQGLLWLQFQDILHRSCCTLHAALLEPLC